MKKRSREPKPLHPVLASAVAGPALIKYLASCNPRLRSQSLRLIHAWLSSEPQLLTEADVGRIWKGLFYCLWHSDKTPNQVALIDRLTSLFLSLRPPLSVEFFRGFLVTLRREWPGIDRLRLDKFYLLIRRFVRVLFEMFRSRGWDLDVVGVYFGVLDKHGFTAEDRLRGNGVNYHIVSVFLEELKSVGFPVKREVVYAILRPFFEAFLKSQDKILLGKMKSCVFNELVKMGRDLLAKKKMGVTCDGQDGVVLLGIVALKMGLSEKLYQVGSGIDCIQGNRKVVLGLHVEFQKLEKELESSGIEIAIPKYHAGDDEVPQLIPLECDTSMLDGETQTAVDSNDVQHQYEDGLPKQRKKAKTCIEEIDKKMKKKRKKKKEIRTHEKAVLETSSLEKNDDLSFSNPENAPGERESGTDEIMFDEETLQRLRRSFEEVDAESDNKSEDLGSPKTPVSLMKKHSKRRRAESANEHANGGLDTFTDDNECVMGSETTVGKSSKKVRFAMKRNLVWKPQNPLPPENLRLPPSVTPRGSALKKGVPPGPIIEMLPLEKRMKNKKKMKKKAAKSRLSLTESSVARLRKKTTQMMISN